MNIFKQNRLNNDCKRLMFYDVVAILFLLPFSYELASYLLLIGWGLFIYKSIKGFFEWHKTPFDFPIIIFTVIAFLSILVSPDPAFSFYNCYNLVGRYVLIYYLAAQSFYQADDDQLKILLGSLGLSLLIVLIYGFMQAFLGIGLNSTEMAWTDEAMFPGLKTRVFSTWENPNLLGGYFDLIMGLLAGVFLLIKQKNIRIIVGVLFCITAICLTLTYARGACLSIAIVIGLYGMIYNRKILIALLALIAVLLISDTTLVERLTSVFTKMDTSSEMRLAFWESTVAMILDHPLLGIGWGAYFMVYPNYDYYMQGNFIKIVHAHNMYLNIMAEIGLFGFVSYLVFFFGVIYKAFRAKATKLNNWVKGYLLGLSFGMAALAINGFTDYVLFNAELSMMVWSLAGISVMINHKITKK